MDKENRAEIPEERCENAADDGRLVINGVALDFDLLDADQVERFHDADEVLIEQLNDSKTYEGLSQADQMRRQCRLVEDFFDAMFGSGTAAEIFGEHNNHLDQHTEAFGRAMQYAMTTTERVNDIIGQYSPQRLQNREQRRAAAKKAGKPSAPKHYDNVTDITKKAKQEAVANAEGHPTQDDGLDLALEGRGLTRDQFEQAVAIAKSLQDGRK